MTYTPEQLAEKHAQCDCLLRSFFQGPCDWCRAHPEEQPPLDYQQVARAAQFAVQKAIDDTVSKAATELGYRAGRELSKLYESANGDSEHQTVAQAIETPETLPEPSEAKGEGSRYHGKDISTEGMEKIEWADEYGHETEVNGVTWVNQGKAGDQ